MQNTTQQTSSMYHLASISFAASQWKEQEHPVKILNKLFCEKKTDKKLLTNIDLRKRNFANDNKIGTAFQWKAHPVPKYSAKTIVMIFFKHIQNYIFCT